jgi:hypothetical protein
MKKITLIKPKISEKDLFRLARAILWQQSVNKTLILHDMAVVREWFKHSEIKGKNPLFSGTLSPTKKD